MDFKNTVLKGKQLRSDTDQTLFQSCMFVIPLKKKLIFKRINDRENFLTKFFEKLWAKKKQKNISLGFFSTKLVYFVYSWRIETSTYLNFHVWVFYLVSIQWTPVIFLYFVHLVPLSSYPSFLLSAAPSKFTLSFILLSYNFRLSSISFLVYISLTLSSLTLLSFHQFHFLTELTCARTVAECQKDWAVSSDPPKRLLPPLCFLLQRTTQQCLSAFCYHCDFRLSTWSDINSSNNPIIGNEGFTTLSEVSICGREKKEFSFHSANLFPRTIHESTLEWAADDHARTDLERARPNSGLG